MIDLDELERLAKDLLWTGDWYDAGCGTVACTYIDQEKFGDYGEIAHPEPVGASEFIAACSPSVILELIRMVKERDTDKFFADAPDPRDELIERLQAENAELRAERDAKQWYPLQGEGNPEYDAEIEALRRDADLYRALRSMHWSDRKLAVVAANDLTPGVLTYNGDSLDAEIAARQHKG